jgi:septal ring factor EnvC (AmiA/AmiB activator)
MTTEETLPQKPSFGRRLLLAFKATFIFLFKVLLTLLIVGAIGAAIYFGAPVLIEEYLLKDVRLNTSQIQEISNQMEAEEKLTSERLDDLQERLASLETQGDAGKQTLADLQAQLSAAENKLQAQSESIQDIEAIQASLEDYAASLAALEDKLAAYQSDLEDIQTEVNTLSRTLAGNQSDIEDLRARLDAREPAQILRQELELLKVMELITRVRVSIGDQNYGLAEDDLEAAQELLLTLGLDLPTEQAAYLETIAARLGQAAENLIRAPSLVNQDLEVAWQFLLQGLPQETQDEATQSTPTAEAGGEQAATPTPTPQP